MNLQREIVLKFKVGGVEREFKVKFPTVGQYIQVESRKAQLTIPKNSLNQSTQYLNLIRQGTTPSFIALDMVEMIAWFEVCIPDLMKGTVGIENIEDLDIFDAKPLLEVYRNVFEPWKEKWEKIFNNVGKEEKEEEKKEDKKEEIEKK